MNLKDILAKDASALTDEEKAFLVSKESELSEDDKAKFADVLETGDEVDEDALKALIGDAVAGALEEKGEKVSALTEKLADGIVSRFFKGAAAQRKRAIEGDPVEKDAKADDITRKFMRALFDGDKAAAKALSTSSTGDDDPKAGLTIPTELRNEVLRIAESQYGVARRDFMYLPFTGPGNTRTIPALGTSVSVFWTDEGGKKKSTQPQFAIVEQTLKKLAAIVPMTEEILEDSGINLTQLIATLFAEAVAKEEDAQFFAGTGNPWTGILYNSQVNSITTEGAASDVTADDLLAMQDETPSGANDGAKYYFHRSWLSQLRTLKDNQGRYILSGPAGGAPGTLWDKQYETLDVLPARTDAEQGDPVIIYGNLKKAAIFGDKQQLRVKLLDQATITDADDETVINLAEQDMVAIRIVERVGYVLALPKAVTVLKVGEDES